MKKENLNENLVTLTGWAVFEGEDSSDDRYDEEDRVISPLFASATAAEEWMLKKISKNPNLIIVKTITEIKNLDRIQFRCSPIYIQEDKAVMWAGWTSLEDFKYHIDYINDNDCSIHTYEGYPHLRVAPHSINISATLLKGE